MIRCVARSCSVTVEPWQSDDQDAMQSRGIQSRRFLIAIAVTLLTRDAVDALPQQRADTASEGGGGSISRPEDVDDVGVSSLTNRTGLTSEIDEDPLTEVIGRRQADSSQQDQVPVSHKNLSMANATLMSLASSNVTNEQETISHSSQDCQSAGGSPITIPRTLAVQTRNDSSLVVIWRHPICDVPFPQYNLTVVNASENPLQSEDHVVYNRIVACLREKKRCKHVINKRVTKSGGRFTVHVTVHNTNGETTGKTANASVLISKPAPDMANTTAEPKSLTPHRNVSSADSSEETEQESSEEETDQETLVVPVRVPVSRIAEIATEATVENNTSTDQDVLVSDGNISTIIMDMPNNDSPIPPSKLQEAPSSLSKDCRSAGESPITMPRNLTMQRANGSSVITWLHPECEGKFQRYILLLVNGTGKDRSPSYDIVYDRTINCTEEQCRHVIKESPSQIEGNYTIYVVGEWPDQKIGKNAAITVPINGSSPKNTNETVRKQSPLPNSSKYSTTTPEPQTNMKLKSEPITSTPVPTPSAVENDSTRSEVEIPQNKQITKEIDRNDDSPQAPETAQTESQVAPTSIDQKQNFTKLNADAPGQENAVVDDKLQVNVPASEPENAAHLEAVDPVPDKNVTPSSEDQIGGGGDASIMDISPRNASTSLSAGEYGTPGSSLKNCRKAEMLPITRPRNLTVTRKIGLSTVSWLQPACEGKFPAYAVVVVNGPDEDPIPIKNIVFSETAACTENQCHRVLETDKIQAGGNYTFYVVGQWPDETIGRNVNVTVHIPTTAKVNTTDGINAVDQLAPAPANKNASSDEAAAERKNTVVTTTEASTSTDRPPANTEHQPASDGTDTETLETASNQTSVDIDNINATGAQAMADGPSEPDPNRGSTTSEDGVGATSAKDGAQLEVSTKMTDTNSNATEDQAAIPDMSENVNQSHQVDDTPKDDEHVTVVRPAARTLCSDNNTKVKEIQNLKIKDNVQSVLLSWERPKCEGNFNIYQIVVVNASTVNSTHRVDYHTKSVCKQQFCMHDINSTTCPTCFKQRDNYTFIVTTHSDMIPFIPRTSIRTLIDIEGCDDFSIPPNAVRVCTGGSKTIHSNRTSQVVWRKAAYCQVHCRPGYGFYEVVDKYYTCENGGVWGPSARAPDCLPTTAVYSASLQYKLVYHPPIVHLQDQIPELVRKFSTILCAHQPDNCTTTTIYTELSPTVPDHLMADLLGGNSSTPMASTHPTGNTIDVTITVEPQVFNISDQLLFTHQTDLVVAGANEDNSFMTLLDYANLKFILPLVQPGVNAKAKSTLCCQKCPEGYAYRASSCVKCPGETC